jgi:hypothetical protein
MFRFLTKLAVVFVATVVGITTMAEENYDDFERHIRPVLVESCYGCHSADADELRAGLRLDMDIGRRVGGDSGPAVIAGDPDGSLLLKAIRYYDDVSPMPPDRKLPDDVVARFRTWIAAGALAPPDNESAVTDDAQSPASESVAHWAFQAPRRAIVLEPHATEPTSDNRIDLILSAHHHRLGIPVSPLADRATLIRRLYLDLLGLPPEYHDVRAFVHDESVRALPDLVDRLLASPRFGERWARHWLDVARFADTKGYVFTEDRNYPDAYRYRDWVIDSINADRPYGVFLRYQLAADHLAPNDPNDLAAMGFLTLGRRFLNNRHDIIDDRIDVTTRGLMGLTVTCARCHDHKYDPIPSADYYSLYGVFDSSHEPGGDPSPLRLVDKEHPVTPVVFLRGQPDRRGEEVPRQFLKVIEGMDRRPFQHGSGRMELANAIASPENPLTARVLVNRVWGHLFGSHLVDTPSDFGTRCPKPPLADLLDDVSVRFVENGESLKWLIRDIVLSKAYGRSSAETLAQRESDPENVYYGRGNRRRLEFEAMRDALLAVSSQLDAKEIGGPSVEITGGSPSNRRALYAHIDRQNFPGLFRVFDVALPDTHNPKRFETTVPQQALFLMNSPFAHQASEHLALALPQNGTTADRIAELYRRTLSRDPDTRELALALDFIMNAETTATFTSADAWTQLAQVLLLSNEFLFLD